MREQRIVLEHRVHVTLVRRQGGDVLAIEENRSLVGKFEAGDQPQTGRLAGTGGAEQGEEAAAGDVEIEGLHRDRPAVTLANAAQPDDRRIVTQPSRTMTWRATV